MFVAALVRLQLALGVLAALFVLLAPPAQAQGGMVGKPLPVCVLPDGPGRDAAALIRHPERFDCTTPQHKLGQGDFWVISADIHAPVDARIPLAVRSGSVWQTGLDFYILYADGRIVRRTTDARGVTPMIQLGAIVEQRLPRDKAQPVRVLWHVKGSANVRAIVLAPKLADVRESFRENLWMAAMYAAFGGLCVALMFYNLALWVALRHRFQLYYCAMVAALLVYAFSSSGALAWAVPDISNNFRLRINFLTLGLIGATALVFSRAFFEERVFRGWLGRVTLVAAGVMAGSGLLFFLAAPYAVRIVDAVFTAAFLAMVSVVFPTLWFAWRRRSNYLWLFAIAWGAPILTSLLRTLANLHLIEPSFWIDNSTILAMAAEALLSSMAIAYRIRLLSKERDEAILGEEFARRLADTDPLTGLLNRRAFLAQAIGREGEHVLQIADLDHFKGVNDTLGHDGGDEVLRVFARILRACAGERALVARMGGEEFAILSAEGEAVECEIVLARLRATRMPFDLTVTASIGTCTGPMASERDWKALYRGADAALFEAKSAGRDRFRSAPRREAA